jgi:hypothetical protein
MTYIKFTVHIATVQRSVYNVNLTVCSTLCDLTINNYMIKLCTLKT